MFSTRRIRLAAAGVAVAVAAAGIGVASSASASAAKPASAARPAASAHHQPKISIARFDLTGWVIDAKYTLGRNTGNTFEQTYTGDMVQGVPVEGPNVGKTFAPAHYVALAVAPKTLYITWVLDDGTIIDAFVMNFRTGVVFDYNPTPGHPESSGTVKILEKGTNRIP